MFIGHYGVAFAAKSAAPKVSLGTWFIAAQLLDLLWPVLLLAGVEHVRIAPGITRVTPLDFYDYPISHSLVTSLAWSAVFAVVYFIARRNVRGSVVLAAAVFSHWILDWITHRPDMPIAPGSSKYVGLGLWDSLPLTILVESAIFVVGIALYVRRTRARDRAGQWALSGLALLLATYFANLFGPPPPSVRAITWSAMGLWVFVAAAYWTDRHRDIRMVQTRAAAES
jgi:uncharacterized membrane protein YhaH (DUF805 family)